MNFNVLTLNSLKQPTGFGSPVFPSLYIQRRPFCHGQRQVSMALTFCMQLLPYNNNFAASSYSAVSSSYFPLTIPLPSGSYNRINLLAANAYGAAT